MVHAPALPLPRAYSPQWLLPSLPAVRAGVHEIAVQAFFLYFVYRSWLYYCSSGNPASLGPLALNASFSLLLLLRRDPVEISRVPHHWAAAWLGTTLPLFFRAEGDGFPALGVVVQIVSMVCILAALFSLRRSLGVVPANRGVKVGGLYRIVRHPLYAGELLFVAGLVLQFPALPNLVLGLCVFAMQLWRCILEERFLSRDPVYCAYRQRTRFRLVPGLL